MSIKKTYKMDYLEGVKNEKKILNKINLFFNDNIKHIEKRYSKYDFEGDKNIYELKTRNNKYNSFKTSLLPYNKIIDTFKTQIFLFDFIDGLYYIEYNEEKFKTFEKKYFVREKRSDYKDKEELYLYIPIFDLIKINDLNIEYKYNYV